MLNTSQLHINWTQQFVLMLQIYYTLISDMLWELFQILASFAGWAVSLCALGAAVQTHAKLTTAGTVIKVLYIKTWFSNYSDYLCFLHEENKESCRETSWCWEAETWAIASHPRGHCTCLGLTVPAQRSLRKSRGIYLLKTMLCSIYRTCHFNHYIHFFFEFRLVSAWWTLWRRKTSMKQWDWWKCRRTRYRLTSPATQGKC